MHFTTFVLPLLVTSLASAKSLSLFGSGQQPLDAKLDVPGDNPLQFCQTTSDYILLIQKVDLAPNPPKSGQKLLIEAAGTFTEEVEEGAYINLSVKYGLITLIRMRADLCDQMKEVDETCPLSGAKVIKKEVDIPKEVPPGKYTVLADVYTKDDEQITCLQATVHFG
ncbi:MAG: Phosphatidylglycerol/phosphatidylinositol transfer protein [Ramalina farinacea]|uniref:Phosphatidylglycerol/phosphatidylinositol transfer protein n=1 Tax=Ramalina farinacea TaxID=258253 RepID=A0AA43QLR7_9LECA|nr:Phosphatidylglycerol/phosphatidylinositol transfer protein [Ramalina farinacea]